jgi:hypothetical protein
MAARLGPSLCPPTPLPSDHSSSHRVRRGRCWPALLARGAALCRPRAVLASVKEAAAAAALRVLPPHTAALNLRQQHSTDQAHVQPGGHLGAAALTRAIKACGSVREVQQLFVGAQPQLTSSHPLCMNGLTHKPPVSGLNDIHRLAMLVQLAHLASAEAAGGASLDRATAGLASQLAEELHQGVRAGSAVASAPRGASNALWAAGKLRLQLPPAWWEDMSQPLRGQAPPPSRPRGPSGPACAPTGRDISNALHGLAHVAAPSARDGSLGHAVQLRGSRSARLQALGSQLLSCATAQALAVSLPARCVAACVRPLGIARQGRAEAYCPSRGRPCPYRPAPPPS